MVAKKKAVAKVEKPAATKKNPKGELVKEVLTFDLTEAEIVEKAESAGSLSTELTELKAEFKAARSDFTGKINAVACDLDKLLKCIDGGTEDREVECTKVHDAKEDTVQYWYDGKMLKERPASDSDRQKAMPFLRKKKEVEAPKFNGIVVTDKAEKVDHKMKQAGDDSVEASL